MVDCLCGRGLIKKGNNNLKPKPINDNNFETINGNGEVNNHTNNNNNNNKNIENDEDSDNSNKTDIEKKKKKKEEKKLQKERKIRSKLIDKELKNSAKAYQAKIKLLLLGAGESGE